MEPYKTDRYLKNLLLRKENFSTLEQILHEEVNLFRRLEQQREEGTLQFGPPVPEEELAGLLSVVKKEVDMFILTAAIPNMAYETLSRSTSVVSLSQRQAFLYPRRLYPRWPVE
jgi:hypothetical protein